jgi:hypothetical protein
VTFHKIDADCIDYIPAQGIDYLESAADNPCSDITVNDVISYARAGLAEIYLVIDGDICGAFCLMYGHNNAGKMVDIVLLGGKDLDTWKEPVKAYIIDIAKKNGCNQLFLIGRHGFGKLFPVLKPVGTVYMMEI